MLVEALLPLKLRCVDAVDEAQWQELIDLDPAAHAMHMPAVTRIIADALPSARAHWLEVVDGEGRLRAAMPMIVRGRYGLLQVVSGASGLYGGPVSLPDSGAACDSVAQAFMRHGGLRTVRRELVWASADPPQGSWSGLRRLQTSVLEVPADADFDQWYDQLLRPARRKERRRLHRHGYHAGTEEGMQFIASFHEIYAERSRQWGSEPFPREGLESLLASGPAWRGFVVRDADDKLVGAHLCVDLGYELFAWLGTASRVDAGSLATLLIEEELRWCHARGRSRLNLGTSADLAGVSEFKQGISATEDPRWILRWQRGRGHY